LADVVVGNFWSKKNSGAYRDWTQERPNQSLVAVLTALLRFP
jgi:hypothetical protein